jgi:hypothetical protein
MPNQSDQLVACKGLRKSKHNESMFIMYVCYMRLMRSPCCLCVYVPSPTNENSEVRRDGYYLTRTWQTSSCFNKYTHNNRNVLCDVFCVVHVTSNIQYVVKGNSVISSSQNSFFMLNLIKFNIQGKMKLHDSF